MSQVINGFGCERGGETYAAFRSVTGTAKAVGSPLQRRLRGRIEQSSEECRVKSLQPGARLVLIRVVPEPLTY